MLRTKQAAGVILMLQVFLALGVMPSNCHLSQLLFIGACFASEQKPFELILQDQALGPQSIKGISEVGISRLVFERCSFPDDSLRLLLQSCPGVSKLVFRRCNLDSGTFKGLRAVKDLSTLEFIECDLSKVDLQPLQNSSIGRICFDGCSLSSDNLKKALAIETLRSFELMHQKSVPVDFSPLGHKPYTVRIVLSDSEVDDSMLKSFSNFSSLVSMNLGGSNITDSQLRYLPRMRYLNLSRCKIDGSGLREIAHPEELLGLDLSFTEFSDDNCGVLNSFSRLSELNLTGTKVSPGCLSCLNRHISELVPKSMPLERWFGMQANAPELAGNLDHLRFPGMGITDSMLKVLNSQMRFKLVDLSGNRLVTDAGIGYLARLKGLQSLNLRDCGLKGETLGDLAKLKNLRTLDISGNSLSDNGLRNLALISSLRTLSLEKSFACGEAELASNRFGFLRGLQAQELCLSADELAIQDFSVLSQIKSLTSLRLNKFECQEAVLEGLSRCKRLKKLELCDCSQVTMKCIEDLINRTKVRDLTLRPAADSSVDFPSVVPLRIRSRCKVRIVE